MRSSRRTWRRGRSTFALELADGINQLVDGLDLGRTVHADEDIELVLDRCDEEGVPAYLESSNPRNIPFYARHGFESTGEIVVGKGAPTVTAMWRNPR